MSTYVKMSEAKIVEEREVYKKRNQWRAAVVLLLRFIVRVQMDCIRYVWRRVRIERVELL